MLWDRLGLGAELSGASIAGGFLRLHVSGHRADHGFGLTHPPPLESIRAALIDARDAGHIPRLRA